MRNQNISDFVASTMNAVLNSDEHKSLFNTRYKFASKKCEKCGGDVKEDGKCACNTSDNHSAWDKQDAESDFESDSDMNMAHSHDSSCDECGEDMQNCQCDDSSADTNDVMMRPNPVQSAPKSAPKPASPSPAPKTAAAFDIAIDSLLTASAALDSIGIDQGSILSLKLASLIVEAKKKTEKKKDDKKSSDKKDSSKDKKTVKKPVKKPPQKPSSSSSKSSGSSSSKSSGSSSKKSS